jgi:hypothetical protein
MPYRWQCYQLKARLAELEKKYRQNSFQLFLSSGWEKAILIIWHSNEADFWNLFDELKLGPWGHSDAQSNLITRDLLADAESLNPILNDLASDASQVGLDQWSTDWLRALVNYSPENEKVVARMYEITGRGDVMVEWQAKNAKSFGRDLNSLPGEFWRDVNHFKTTVEREWDRKASDWSPDRLVFLSEISISFDESAGAKRTLR